MDLPNIDDMLCSDPVRRPPVVIRAASDQGRVVVPSQSAPEHHQGHHQHGGEPDARVVRMLFSGAGVLTSTSSTADSIGDQSTTTGTWRVYYPVIVHEPWLDSASNDLKPRVLVGRIIPAVDFSPKSTEGVTHRQHRERNVKRPKRPIGT